MEITRQYKPPTKYDYADMETVWLVNEQDHYLMYVQISATSHEPRWYLVGKFPLDTPKDRLIKASKKPFIYNLFTE